MPNRKYGNLMLLRQNVNTTLYDKLYVKTCFHIDAWIYQTRDDELYLAIQTSAGGQHILDRDMYAISDNGLRKTLWDDDIVRDGLQRHARSPWSRRNAPWLDAMHWRDVYPILRQPRRGFKGHVSVVLHYIYTDPTVIDPFSGIENMYATTGRKDRDAARVLVGPSQATKPTPHKWPARERSLLRTLDKILKPLSDKTD